MINLKRQLKTILLIFLGVIIIFMFYGFFIKKDYENNRYAEKLVDFIKSSDQTGNLGDIVNLPWDEVCAFLPYSMESPTSFYLPDYTLETSVPPLQNDATWALLFKDDKTKKAFFVKMPLAPDRNLKSNQCYGRNLFIEKKEYISKLNQKKYKTILIYTP